MTVHLAAAWLASSLVGSTAALSAFSRCYDFRGNELAPVYGPCNTSASAVASSCCAIYNYAAPDVCTMSGLCMTTKSGLEGGLYAVGCTDPAGTAEGCVSMCNHVKTPDWSHAHVTFCDKEHWCCRKQNLFDPDSEVDCCNDTSARVAVIDVTTKLSEGNSSDAAGDNETSTSTTSGGASQQSTSPARTESSAGGGSGTTVSIVAGVLGGLLLLVAVAFVVHLVRRRRHAQSEGYVTHSYADAGHDAAMEAPISPGPRVEAGGTAMSELPASLSR